MFRSATYASPTIYILQTLLYKKHIFNIFFKKYLVMSKKSSTFAPKLKKTIINNLKFKTLWKVYVIYQFGQ